MKTAKRFIGFLLALVLVVTCVPLSARAAGYVAGSSPGASLKWTLYDDGLLEISGTGDMTYCDIEESVPWFQYRDYIRRVEIAEGITSITNFAFKGCWNLVSVQIPDSVTTIDNQAFYQCTRLQKADLPAGLTSIGSYAFYMCEDLRRVEFGPSLESIGNYAYNMCRNLAAVVIPASVTQIGNYAFQACDSLRVCQFLGDPLNFNTNIFSGDLDLICYYPADNDLWDIVVNSVRDVTWEAVEAGASAIPAEPAPAAAAPASPLAPGGTVLGTGSCGRNTKWTMYENGLLVISGTGGMDDVSGWGRYMQDVQAVIFEEGVTEVGDSALSGHGSLTYVSIPSTVTRVGQYAFAYCWDLEQVVFAGTPEMDHKVFDSVSVDCYYPAGRWDFRDRIAYGGDNVDWLPYTAAEPAPTQPTEPEPTEPVPTVPAPTEPEPTEPPVIEEVADGTCGADVGWSLTSDGTLTISGTGDMEDYPEEFPGWDSYADMLKKVVVEEGVTHIGDYAFWGYGGIEEVVLPESLRSIGGVAFGYCAGLKEITIPANVQEMRDYAFAKCTGLEMITFRGSVPAMGGDIFLEVDAMAAHPFDDPSWTDEARQDYGGMLSWLIGGTPLGLRLEYAPAVTAYALGEQVDLSGIWVIAVYDGGHEELLKSGVLTLESADTTSVGAHTAVASYMGLTVEFPIYVHASRKIVEVDKNHWPESPHDYGSNMNDSQYITYGGADSLSLTFSSQTALEAGYDFLNIYDAYDNQIASFSGYEAAGVTVVVPGSSARIQLVSDESYGDYGYSLSAVTADVLEHVGQTVEGTEPTCNTDGYTSGIICDICDQTVGGQVIPALGHDYSPWQPMDNSSDMYRVCANCEYYDHLVVDKLFTYAGDSEYGELTLEEIQSLYKAVVWAMEAEYADQPSCEAPYNIGRLTDACLDNLTAQLNFFRRLAKLDSVIWYEGEVELAQAATVADAAIGQLTHYPGQPADMPDDIYELGALGASSSNLAWGTSMGMMDSLLGYLDDSDMSNIDRVGHRRWALNPNMATTGFGVTVAGTRSSYHAMYAFDTSNYGNSNADFVAYPGGNRVYPNEFFESHMAWSVQLNPDSFRSPNPDEVQVSLIRQSDGKQWILNNQADSSEAGYFNVDTVTYGDGYAVIFRPADVSEYQGVYQVLISGLRTKDNQMAAITYEVDFQSLFEPAHTHTPKVVGAIEPTCAAFGYSGDTYCADCGELVEQGTYVNPLGHDMVNGTCTRCGHQDVLKGDVNGDGEVNSDDAVHLLYHTLFGDLYPVNQDSDFNGDGEVNSDDAVHLLYHTLFGDLYPLN